MPTHDYSCLSFLLYEIGVGEHGFHRLRVDAGRKELLYGLARFVFSIDHFVAATTAKRSTELDGCPFDISELHAMQASVEGKPASRPPLVKMTSVYSVAP